MAHQWKGRVVAALADLDRSSRIRRSRRAARAPSPSRCTLGAPSRGEVFFDERPDNRGALLDRQSVHDGQSSQLPQGQYAITFRVKVTIDILGKRLILLGNASGARRSGPLTT